MQKSFAFFQCPRSRRTLLSVLASSKTVDPFPLGLAALRMSHISKRNVSTVVSSPLEDMKQMAQTKHLCDENGFRLPDIHWTFVISCCSKFDEVRGCSCLWMEDEEVDVFICICISLSSHWLDVPEFHEYMHCTTLHSSLYGS